MLPPCPCVALVRFYHMFTVMMLRSFGCSVPFSFLFLLFFYIFCLLFPSFSRFAAKKGQNEDLVHRRGGLNGSKGR